MYLLNNLLVYGFLWQGNITNNSYPRISLTSLTLHLPNALLHVYPAACHCMVGRNRVLCVRQSPSISPLWDCHCMARGSAVSATACR